VDKNLFLLLKDILG
jgi:hypothetical protein